MEFKNNMNSLEFSSMIAPRLQSTQKDPFDQFCQKISAFFHRLFSNVPARQNPNPIQHNVPNTVIVEERRSSIVVEEKESELKRIERLSLAMIADLETLSIPEIPKCPMQAICENKIDENIHNHNPLDKAIEQGDVETVKRLFKAGAKISKVNEESFYEILKSLLLKDDYSFAECLLEFTIEDKKIDLFKLNEIISKKGKIGDFLEKSLVNAMLCFTEYYNNRDAINKLDEKGYSPLYYAVRNNDVCLIKLLIEFGADPLGSNDKFNKTPIHRAIKDFFYSRNDSIIKVFLDSSKISGGTIVSGLIRMEVEIEKNLQEYNEIKKHIFEYAKDKNIKSLYKKISLIKTFFQMNGLSGWVPFKGCPIEMDGYSPIIMQKKKSSILKEYFEKIEKQNIKELHSNDNRLLAYFKNRYTERNSSSLIDFEVKANRIKNNELEGLSSGWNGHSTEVVFSNGYVGIFNHRLTSLYLDVYKINITLVTEDHLEKIYSLLYKSRDESQKILQDLLKEWNAKKDEFCENIFNQENVQNRAQNYGNCSFKTRNIVSRFIQIMQISPETYPTDLEELEKLKKNVDEVVERTKRQSRFNKISFLKKLLVEGNLTDEDKAWFEPAWKNIRRNWRKIGAPAAETEIIKFINEHDMTKKWKLSVVDLRTDFKEPSRSLKAMKEKIRTLETLEGALTDLKKVIEFYNLRTEEDEKWLENTWYVLEEQWEETSPTTDTGEVTEETKLIKAINEHRIINNLKINILNISPEHKAILLKLKNQ